MMIEKTTMEEAGKRERITFPEEFFKAEMREGFFIEEKMKRAWAAQLEVLAEIDDICKRNGINWFADSGTLLGAVRHKGFIPWDDDVDIAMLREDYERFFPIAERELPKGWVIRDWRNGGGGAYGRVINGSDCGREAGEVRKLRFHGCPYVVGVDIFPIDAVPDHQEEGEAWHLLLEFLWALLLSLEGHSKDEFLMTKEGREQALRQAEEWCGITFDREQQLQQQIRNLMLRLVQMYQGEETQELEMAVYDWEGGRKLKYKREWYADAVLLPFEQLKLPAPCGYAQVCRVVYGEDYMTPKIKKGGHDYPFYKAQEKEWERSD